MQDVLHFTYEDDVFPVKGADCIRAIVERDWKYAVYYDPFTGAPTEYEMYDLARDPLEMTNLAHAVAPHAGVRGRACAAASAAHRRDGGATARPRTKFAGRRSTNSARRERRRSRRVGPRTRRGPHGFRPRCRRADD